MLGFRRSIGFAVVGTTLAIATIVTVPLVTPPLLAQQSGGMMGMGRGDSATTAIMQVVHALMTNHDKLRRTVTNLPNGIRTLTESDDPAMAASIKAHVARTGVLVSKAEDPDLPMSSPSLHGVLRRGTSITRTTKETKKGVAVTETSNDPATVALVQQHAAEVTDMVNRGMAAIHEQMMKNGGMGHDMAGGTMAGMTHDTSAAPFATLQARGKQAMGVDQYTSTHHFDDMADGGRIELQRDVDDPVGVVQIRAHLQEIASAFKGGDFTTPAFVHMQSVPGANIMASKRAMITYTFSALPRGGQLLIVSKDPSAIAAIHEFLAFQRMDHRAK